MVGNVEVIVLEVRLVPRSDEISQEVVVSPVLKKDTLFGKGYALFATRIPFVQDGHYGIFQTHIVFAIIDNEGIVCRAAFVLGRIVAILFVLPVETVYPKGIHQSAVEL